ncbi:Cysteine--tRNA ligase, partial [Pseudomonas syringae pv. actinidiae]
MPNLHWVMRNRKTVSSSNAKVTSARTSRTRNPVNQSSTARSRCGIPGPEMSEGQIVLSIYNTLTKSKEVFKPLDGNKVRMYVCGMTVYDYCHLGHGRSMVAFDLVTRWLRFSGYDLTYVRNITDIDDKIINRARDNGESFDALTARMIDAMHEDEARLNILKPDMEPRATDHIPGMHAMIQTLIDK